MSRRHYVAIALVLSAVVTIGHSPRAATGPAVIIRWNQLIQATLPPPGNPLTPRTYALAHIAMFDAVNAIEREFEFYRVRPLPQDGGSAAAAAAQAAHDVLAALNPGASSTYHAVLQEDLSGHPSAVVRRGAAVGARVAKEILAWRRDDGWIVSTQPPYSEPPLPGRWQPTPPANAAAAFTHLQNAAPLAALSATQFLPPPPPSLTSQRYANDLLEVSSLGRSDSITRTDEQTATARLWSAVGTTTGFFAVWNNVARDAVQAHHLSLVEAARLFVLVNVSIHDALQTTQASKFVYGVWRPVTAIRQADSDLNPQTPADPTWLPLIPTPPYPSYAGNLATIGASAARALARAVGRDDVDMAISWATASGPVIRHYDSFSAAAEEEFMARIYGGVHYRFDQEAGRDVGQKVADFVFDHYMTPYRH